MESVHWLSTVKLNFSSCTGLWPAFILIPTCLPLTKSKLVFAEPERCLLPMVLVSVCAWAVRIALSTSAIIRVIFFRDVDIGSIFYVFIWQTMLWLIWL